MAPDDVYACSIFRVIYHLFVKAAKDPAFGPAHAVSTFKIVSFEKFTVRLKSVEY